MEQLHLRGASRAPAAQAGLHNSFKNITIMTNIFIYHRIGVFNVGRSNPTVQSGAVHRTARPAHTEKAGASSPFTPARFTDHSDISNIHTYKEIVAFSNGQSLNEVEKKVEQGKHPYQVFFMCMVGAAIGAVIVMIAVLLP